MIGRSIWTAFLPVGGKLVGALFAAKMVDSVLCLQGIGLLLGHQLVAHRIFNEHVGDGAAVANLLILTLLIFA